MDSQQPGMIVRRIYLANQEVGKFSTLEDTAIENMLLKYGEVLLQIGVNQRAYDGAKRILAHLSFEQDYRNGNYDDVIERHRAEKATAADGDFAPVVVPPSLIARRVE